MAILYVRSTDGSDSDNGTTWALAKATLAGAFAIASAGDTIYVSQAHAETQASAMTLTSPGTAASPVRVICGNDAAEPPTALATTATITTTGANNMSFAGCAYVYGIAFNCGTGNVTANILFNSATAWYWRLEACALKLNSTSTGARTITFGNAATTANDQLIELHNSTLGFGHANHVVTIAGAGIIWTGTASAITGTAPTVLLNFGGGGGAPIFLNGVDLSAIASGGSLVNAAGAVCAEVTIENCKLGSTVSLTTGTNPGQGGPRVWLINSDSADTNYRYQKHDYRGNITNETTIVRTGGATDGTTALSFKAVSSANVHFFAPLFSDWCYYWLDSTGAVTVAIETVTDNVTLTDAEAWIEVEYLGTSGFPLSSFAHDRAADILATPANQTTSTETWTTTGLTTPVKQVLSKEVTTAEKGVIRARLCLAKASTTAYFCPEVLTGASRSYMTSGGYANEGVASGGGAPYHGAMSGGML